MTQPEVWLWARLKRLHAQGYHFRRQRAFHGYFLGFVCLDRRLVVELDGGHHNEPAQAEHDRIRDAVLQRAGFNVLRFANSSVRTDINAVMDAIILALKAAPSVLSKGDPAG